MENDKVTLWRSAIEQERRAEYGRAIQRNREYRRNAAGRAKVVHPRYGELVVPHGSNLEAIMNAAEFWGCDWAEIMDAEVVLAPQGAEPVAKPKEIEAPMLHGLIGA